jgi:hypothetical protein
VSDENDARIKQPLPENADRVFAKDETSGVAPVPVGDRVGHADEAGGEEPWLDRMRFDIEANENLRARGRDRARLLASAAGEHYLIPDRLSNLANLIESSRHSRQTRAGLVPSTV